MNYRKNNNKVLYGILLITIAILMFLSSFELLPPGIITQAISYTLIIFGLYSLLKRDFYKGLFAIAFGFKFSPIILIQYLDFNKIGWFTLIFITFLLATGLETLFGKKFAWRKKYKDGRFVGAEFSNKASNQDDLAGEYVMASVNMGESSRYISTTNLKEADLKCNLGSLSAYFIGSQIQNDININVDCRFGNIDLYLPRDWHIQDNIGVSLGNVDIKQNRPKSDYTVYLNGSVNLGNIDVYFN
ncbi:MAG: hypothetical protein GX769_02470 [Erysipelothrix sp.]|nr:hypothetical protein [Erysipelothrix sp.]